MAEGASRGRDTAGFTFYSMARRHDAEGGGKTKSHRKKTKKRDSNTRRRGGEGDGTSAQNLYRWIHRDLTRLGAWKREKKKIPREVKNDGDRGRGGSYLWGGNRRIGVKK